MKASELRIGNYLVDREERLCRVQTLRPYWNESQIEATAIKGPQTSLPNKPIPLTEEWLKKFGFKEKTHTFVFGNISIKQQTKSCFFYHTGFNLRYVHQLQNLFFALTGEELKFE